MNNRIMFLEQPFMPRVAYEGEGEGGTPAPETTGDDQGTDVSESADPKAGLDRPEADMYPEQETERLEKEKKKEAEIAAAKGDSDEGEDEGEDADANAEGDGEEKKDDNEAKDIDLQSVPENAEDYHIVLPDGMEMDTELFNEMAPLWKDKGLTHAEAQEMTDKYIARQQANQDASAEQQDATINEWASQTKADKEIGGQNLEASIKAGERALDAYGNKAFRAMLVETGVGNHPEVVRFMSKVGATVTDDDIPTPGGMTGGSPNLSDDAAAAELYGKTTPTTKHG